LLVQIEIGCINVFTIKEMVRLGRIHFADAADNIIIVGHIIRIHIAGLDACFKFGILVQGMGIIAFKSIDIDGAGQVAGEGSLSFHRGIWCIGNIVEMLVAAGRVADIIHVDGQFPSGGVELMAEIEVDGAVLPGVFGSAG